MKIISILIIFIFYNSMIDSLLDALFFFSSRRRHTRFSRDWSSDVCSSDLRQEHGTIFLSGIQALVRLPLEQHRADARRGLNTATLISGYRGSPLGGLDLTLERNPDLLRDHHVVFISGVNEDLGATAIYGSQLANLFPRARYDGVLGMWYGKGPGVDRTGDIFKHGNFAGVAAEGEDPAVAATIRCPSRRPCPPTRRSRSTT